VAESLILDWPQAVQAGATVCGGKGWNLGRLHRYGFPVPAGGVVVAAVYRRLMQRPAVQALRAELAGVSAADAVHPDVDRKLAALRAALEAADLPAELTGALDSFLAGADLARVPLAVRSSATAEDSPTASFAGIHRSFLDVTGTAAVVRAVQGCYASLWTPQALAYRRRLGLADEQVACAVVLCALVPAVQAGVAFSCDPRTGRRDVVTLSAAAGLGEAVVGGRINPEEITVVQARGRLRVRERRSPAGRVLTDDQALELSRLAVRVQWALGDGQDPQDLEWAHDGRRFWLLQARPVTRLPRRTFPAIARLPAIWSTANLKENIAAIPSTLGWHMLQAALWEVLYAPLEAVGYPVPPGMEMVHRFAGRLYFDLSSLQWAFYDALGLSPADTNRALGGPQPALPVPAGHPFRGPRGWRRLRAGLKLLRLGRRVVRQAPRLVAEVHALARRLKARDLSRRSRAELFDLLYQAGDRFVGFGRVFLLAGTEAGLWQQPLQGLLGWLVPDRGRALAAALMAGSGQVTSAEQGYRLLDLAAAARRDPAAQAYLSRDPLDPHGWRSLAAGAPFRVELERFLAEFGHRGVGEVDIANPRWNEDPTYLLEQVRALLVPGSPGPTKETARAVRAAAEAEVARRTRWWGPLVRWLAARARQGAALREAGKSAVVALLEPQRAVVLEVGRRLVAAGALEYPSDVFHLAGTDVEMYLRGEWDGTGARALVADRQAQAAAWLAEAPPDVFLLDGDGRPVAWESAEGRAPSAEHADAPHVACRAPRFTLHGVGVAAGRASGPARLIRHPAEGYRLQMGEVLVAPSTDPGWTPLFLRAAAVVMEVGGYLSHGAVVAREYGLPAVVNIPGLLNAVQDGQLLIVDGDAGRVSVADERIP
jgi:pyruvate,water dikinase